jgi:hypothetical protein
MNALGRSIDRGLVKLGRSIDRGLDKLLATSRIDRGLNKLSPELIATAQEKTAATIFKIMLTFAGAASFCLLTLLGTDTAFITNGERLDVPVAGPVSFLGFMIIGPLVLIGLRIYLQIYVEHLRKLERIGQRLHTVRRAPTLIFLKNRLLRVFTGIVFYLLLPLTMLFFTWKGAVLTGWWVSGLIGATTVVIVSHVMLPAELPWRLKALLSLGVAIVPTAFVLFGALPVWRPFNLFRADLSEQWWLSRWDLTAANLR